MLRKSIFITILALLLPLEALAQVNATVTGTVTDATGALIPGVEVTATNVNTGISTVQTTNETGAYLFASLQPGTYRVSSALSGFQTQSFQNVQLSQGQQVRLNFKLEVATFGTAIEITTDVDAVLATTSASIGDTLPEIEVRNLPLAVRDVLALIKTTPGTVDRNFAGQGTRSLNVTRDGLIVNDVRYGAGTEESGQNATFVSADLVEEVQVVTASIDAESGRGSGQVRLQTRSGTNEFHGALFYTNNNSALNAQNWFDNLRSAEKSYLNRHQYGGRLGGPIIRNKAFFFVLIDNQRYVEKENYVAAVFTEQARQGIFRYIPGRRNGNAFSPRPSVDLAGNPLGPVASFNLFTDVNDPFRRGITTVPYWRDVLTKHMPPANDFTIGDGLNVAGHRWLRRIDGLGGGNLVGNNNNRNQLNLRFDYQATNNNRVTFTTSRETAWSTRAREWPAGFDGEDSYVPNVMTAAWVSTISPTVLNEFRIGRKQTGFFRNDPFTIGCCKGDSSHDRTAAAQTLLDTLPKINGYPLYPITNVSRPGVRSRGTLDIAVYARRSFDSTRGNTNPTWQASDNLSWTTGNHSFKAGFEFVSQWSDGWNFTSEQFPSAAFGEGPSPVRGISSARFPGLQAADAIMAAEILNDLSGSIAFLTQGFIINSSRATTWDTWLGEGRRLRGLTQNDWATYFKDTWNVTNNLTLNLGLRYDKYGVLYEGNGLMPVAVGGQAGAFGISGTDFNSWWNPYATGGTETLIHLVGKHSPHPELKMWNDDWNNFAPSFGFSYNVPWIDRPTVIRGGYGINYAGAPVMLDYELAFLNSPGTVDIEIQSPSQLGFPYLNLETAISAGVLPLTPAIGKPDPAGTVRVPLTDRNQEFNTNVDDRATPYIQSFNLSLQHELARNLTLEVSYIGNKATKLYANTELNETNVFENRLLEAFNVTRAGGDHPLFDRIMMGLRVPGAGRVDGVTLTGSQALRLYGVTDNWLADGNVGAFADFLNRSSAITGVPGGFLRNGRLPENFIVVNPQFRRVELWGADRNSNYHSLQVQLRKRLSQSFSGQFSYTWSKGLGDAINAVIRNDTNMLDPRNRARNKGRLSFDRTHAFNAHGTWELPFGPGRALLADAPNWVHGMVEGWQLSSIFTYHSGAPLTLTSPNLTMGGNRIVSVPDAVGPIPKSLGNVKVGRGFVEYFEGLSFASAPLPDFGSDPANLRADFGNRVIVDSAGKVLLANPEPGRVGTLGLRYLEGPGRLGLDVGLSKSVRLTEGTTLTVRADAVNILNTPQWANPNVDINSTNFGRITSASGERTITINARIDF